MTMGGYRSDARPPMGLLLKTHTCIGMHASRVGFSGLHVFSSQIMTNTDRRTHTHTHTYIYGQPLRVACAPKQRPDARK